MTCTVDKCCSCVNLRAGVITIACIWMLKDSFCFGFSLFLTQGLDKAVDDLQSSSGYWKDVKPEDRDAIATFMKGAYWMQVVFDVIFCVAIPLDIMLLLGALNRRRKLLRGWMVAYAVLFVPILLLGILNVAGTFLYSQQQGAAATFGLLVHIGLMVYFWVVVRSYCLELEEGAPPSMAGKTFRTTPTGGDHPPHGTFGDADSFTSPPSYTISMQPPAPYRYSSNP